MTEYQSTVDVDGKFQLPCTLSYSEDTWEVKYHFSPTNQDVVLGGTISDGKLTMTRDSSGYAGPLLPTFQKLYDQAVQNQ